jgi:predicted dehydrogenase
MRLLILGTGSMANAHADAFKAIDGVTLTACVDVNREAANAFAKDHGIAHVFDNLDAALASGTCNAAANVTPDAVHHPTTLTLLNAGLHVFCEKPLATNYTHASEMAELAKRKGAITGVNLTYRNVPALSKAQALIADGTIGAPRHFEASYLQSWLTQDAWGAWDSEPRWLWRLSTAHGSHGALGDIGIHIIDFLSFAAGSEINALTCTLKTFDKAPDNTIGDYTLDANDSFSMTATLQDGATGVIHASRFASGHINDVRLKIFGTKGGLDVSNEGERGLLRLSTGEDLQNGTWRDVAFEDTPSTYQRFASAVASGQQMSPDFATAARHQRVLDSAVTSNDTGRAIAL